MRWPTVLLFGSLAAAGCRSNCDLVEAELRSREGQVRELRDELDRAEACNQALQRELQDLRQGAGPVPGPGPGALAFGVKEVVLGRGTGGYDDDQCPGDEALQVVLEPRDGDGHAVKAPGTLHVEALEISPEGLKVPFSAWDLSRGQLRKTWRSGLFSNGYVVVLPWKRTPSSPRVRVVARFVGTDGRAFEADKDVTIRLPAGGLPGKPEMLPAPTPLGPELPRVLPGATPAASPDGPLLGHWTPARRTAGGKGIESTSLRPLAGGAQLLPPVPER